MGSEGHGSVAHQSLNPLGSDHIGGEDEHTQQKQTVSSILIHRPQQDREQLEELKRIHNLIFEDVRERPNGNLQDVIIVHLGVVGAMDDLVDGAAPEPSLESDDLVGGVAEVEFPLLEHEEEYLLFCGFELLEVQVRDPVLPGCPRHLLLDEHVAGFKQIVANRTFDYAVLNFGLYFLGPVPEDVGETYDKFGGYSS